MHEKGGKNTNEITTKEIPKKRPKMKKFFLLHFFASHPLENGMERNKQKEILRIRVPPLFYLLFLLLLSHISSRFSFIVFNEKLYLCTRDEKKDFPPAIRNKGKISTVDTTSFELNSEQNRID